MRIDKDLVAASATPLVLAILVEDDQAGRLVRDGRRDVGKTPPGLGVLQVGDPEPEHRRQREREERPPERRPVDPPRQLLPDPCPHRALSRPPA